MMTGRAYEDYAPGFRAGWEGRVRHDGRSFDAAESDSMVDYNLARPEREPSWQEVRPAARAAWDRFDSNWKGMQWFCALAYGTFGPSS